MEADHVLANVRHLHSDVAQQTLEVLSRLENVAKVVTDAAAQVNQGKTVLHRQNEAFLMARIKEITGAVADLKGIESAMQSAAEKQANVVLIPLATSLSEQVTKLTAKDTFAMKFMQETKVTQKQMADSAQKIIATIPIVIIGVVILVVLAFFAGHYTK